MHPKVFMHALYLKRGKSLVADWWRENLFNILCGQRKHERYRREGKNSSFLQSQGSRRWKIVVEKVGHADAMSVAEGPCELVDSFMMNWADSVAYTKRHT